MIDVVAAVIVRDQLVLGARRAEHKDLAGFWEFPGGKIEPGEHPVQALHRELKEELSIEVRAGDWIGESLFKSDSHEIRLIAYWCYWLSGELRLTDHDAVEWLTVNEMFTKRWAPADIPLVEKIVNRGLLTMTDFSQKSES